jgi:hypothetical protein
MKCEMGKCVNTKETSLTVFVSFCLEQNIYFSFPPEWKMSPDLQHRMEFHFTVS